MTIPVYWFVFMLAGFVLATPFLAAMMRAIGRSGAWLLTGLAAAVAAAEQICNLAGYPLTFLQSFPWRGLLVYYLLGFVLEYYPPSTRARARLVCVGAVRPGLDRCHAISVRRPADAGRPHAHGCVRDGGGRGVPVLPVRRAHHVGAGAQGDYLAGGVLLHDLSGAFAAVQGADRPADSRAHGRWSAGISVLMFAATLLAALLFAVIADTVVLKLVQRLLRKVRL